MKKIKLLINGGTGQLGQSFQAVANEFPDFILICPSRQEHDITDAPDIVGYLREVKPDYYINTAAYTEVDKAETEKEIAFRVNVNGVKNTATACKELNIPYIHFSSDYVYNNDVNRLLLESDSLNPAGYYAFTKRESEKVLTELGLAHLTFRVSWLYSPYRKNFVKTMYNLMQKNDAVNVVNDQIGSPCNTVDLARDILNILQRDSTEKDLIQRNSGIYNYTQLGTASWYDIVIEMKEILNLDTEVNAVDTDFFPRPVKRPAFSLMNLSKVQDTFGIKLRHWKEALRDCLKEIA